MLADTLGRYGEGVDGIRALSVGLDKKEEDLLQRRLAF